MGKLRSMLPGEERRGGGATRTPEIGAAGRRCIDGEAAALVEAEAVAHVGDIDVVAVGVVAADLEHVPALPRARLRLADRAHQVAHLELHAFAHGLAEGGEDQRLAARQHAHLQPVLLLEVVEELGEGDVGAHVHVEAVPQGPRLGEHLVLGCLDGVGETEEGQRQVHEAVLQLRHALLQQHLDELYANKAGDDGGGGGDGGDDLAGDALSLESVRLGDLVVARAQVGRRDDEVDVEVAVVVLLEDGGRHAPGGEGVAGRKLREGALHVVRIDLSGARRGGRGVRVSGRDLDALLGRELGHHDALHLVLHVGRVVHRGYAVVGGVEVGGGDDKAEVKRIVRVELQRRRRPLRTGPERHAGCGDEVRGEAVQELADSVVVQLLELEARPHNAVLERARLGLDQARHEVVQGHTPRTRRLLLQPLEVVGVVEVCIDVVGALPEEALEEVAGPLDGVLDGVGEVLEGADGDALLRRIVRRAVVLRQERHHHLCVALGAECAGLEEGLAEVDAAAIHVQPRLHVVQRIAHPVQRVPEVVVIHIFGLGGDADGVGEDVHGGVHPLRRLRRRRRFHFADVGLAEQELARQVRLLDGVHVRHVHRARAGPQPHHRPVLQHLAADRARAHEEVLEVAEGALGVLTKHRDLSVVPRPNRGGGCLRDGVAGQGVDCVEVEPLLDGRELARRRLQHLLRRDAPQHRRHWVDVAGCGHRAFGEERLVEGVHLVRDAGPVDVFAQRQHLRRVLRVVWGGQGGVLGGEGVEGLEQDVQLLRAIEMGEVVAQELRLRQRLRQRQEMELGGEFDLSGVAAALVRLVSARVLDRERVRPEDFDGAGGAVVELGHADDLGEGDVVGVLEAMSRLVQRRHHAGVLLSDGGDHDGERLLAVRVVHGERVAEVAEYVPSQAARLRRDERHPVRSAHAGHTQLLGPRRLRHDYDLELADGCVRQRTDVRADGDVPVQLLQLAQAGVRTPRPDVLLAHIELRT
mmetsp:Transcript_25221/g.43551  ORF Transcript_25221/g.43551 Transcript_25221/m.43551 type:complete len:980 (-) Transcript_25221:283-3222(-)